MPYNWQRKQENESVENDFAHHGGGMKHFPVSTMTLRIRPPDPTRRIAEKGRCEESCNPQSCTQGHHDIGQPLDELLLESAEVIMQSRHLDQADHGAPKKVACICELTRVSEAVKAFI